MIYARLLVLFGICAPMVSIGLLSDKWGWLVFGIVLAITMFIPGRKEPKSHLNDLASITVQIQDAQSMLCSRNLSPGERKILENHRHILKKKEAEFWEKHKWSADGKIIEK